MSDDDTGRDDRPGKIRLVFDFAIDKARSALPSECKFSIASDPEGAVVRAFPSEQRPRLDLRFSVGADDSIFAVIREKAILGAGGLYDDRIVDIVAAVIIEAVAKEYQ